MTDTAYAALEAVPFRVTNPELIPSQRYYDPEFFALEKEKLWPHVWQMACRLEEIPNVGDYVEYTILDKSVIVVNGCGNTYRLIAAVHFDHGMVYTLRFFTHAEYSKDKWKDEL